MIPPPPTQTERIKAHLEAGTDVYVSAQGNKSHYAEVEGQWWVWFTHKDKWMRKRCSPPPSLVLASELPKGLADDIRRRVAHAVECRPRPVEEWRPVPSTRNRYHASSWGRVRGPFKVLRQAVLSRYLTITTADATHLVHRLVAEAFYGPIPEGHVVRHLNGNPLDNHVSNLRIGTYEENEADKDIHGTKAVREKNGYGKLTAEQVAEIAASDEHAEKLADKYGVHWGHIYKIKRMVRLGLDRLPSSGTFTDPGKRVAQYRKKAFALEFSD